mgnify:CR=1 FL=1
MTIEFFSYQASILNPLLKLLILAVFALAAVLLYQCLRRYGGILRQISQLLFIAACAASISAFFRFQGDFYENFKWGESIVGLFVAIVLLLIACTVRKKIHAIASLFRGGEKPP